MKDIKELEKYYNDEISPNLGILRGLMNTSKYVIIVTLIAFANFFIGVGGDNANIGLIISGVVTAIGFLFLYLNNKKITSFFRDNVFMPIIKQIESEQLTFTMNGSVNESEIRQSKLLYFSNDYTLSQNKLLQYREKNRTIKMVNVTLKNTTRDADGDSDTTTTEGLFVVIPTKMRIEGTTVLYPDIAERAGGFVGQLLQSKKLDDLKQIRLDSPNFEKEFIVYGDDELIAHYLLKHTVMEALIEVAKKFKFQFQISFVDGKMYLFFAFTGGWFEPVVEIDKKKENSLSFDMIKKDIEAITTAIDLAHRIEKHHHILD